MSDNTFSGNIPDLFENANYRFARCCNGDAYNVLLGGTYLGEITQDSMSNVYFHPAKSAILSTENMNFIAKGMEFIREVGS